MADFLSLFDGPSVKKINSNENSCFLLNVYSFKHLARDVETTGDGKVYKFLKENI